MKYTQIDSWTASAAAGVAERFRNGQLTRREVLRLLGGTGLAASGALMIGGRAVAQGAGTPIPAVTPAIGKQANGSMIWRVKVADMRMDQTPIVELHTYFPNEITIAEGDAIWFDFGMLGFHTVSFLSGGDVPPFWITDPELGTPVPYVGGTPTAEDATKLITNPDVVFPSGGDSYDGTGYVSSGIDVFRDPTQPYVLTFTKAGSYDYLCDVHNAVMKGKVIVQAAGSAPPHTQAEYDTMTQAEITKLHAQADAEIATYKDTKQTKNADGSTTFDVIAGGGGDSPVRLQGFFPSELEVEVGDTVKWTHHAPHEPHTVSFIGAGETPPEDPVSQFADGRPKFGQSPLTLLPQGGNVWSGKGWVNSGFMGGIVPGEPMEYSLTFDTPGDFIYYCIIHGDSKGNGMAAMLKVSPA